VGYVKIGNFRQITRYNSQRSTVTSIVNLVWLQVYHTERPGVCSTFAAMQCVVQVHQRQLILVRIYLAEDILAAVFINDCLLTNIQKILTVVVTFCVSRR